MLKVTLAGLRAHRWRLAATVLATALGTAFMAGTLIFMNTLRSAFEDAFAQGDRGIAVAVTGSTTDPAHKFVPADLLTNVRSVSGVDAAAGRLVGDVGLAERNGHRIAGQGATLGVGVPADTRFNWIHIDEGRRPRTSNEIIIDRDTYQRLHAKIGDDFGVVTSKGVVRDFTLVGKADVGLDRRFETTSVIGFDMPTAAAVTGVHHFDEIDVIASPGTSPDSLRARVGAALRGQPVVLRTGSQKTQDDINALTNNTAVIEQGLIAFSTLSLLIAAMVIANTFRILTTQRRRESALLRCVGATRRQLFAAILTEAAIIATVASFLGLGLGVLIAAGLRMLFQHLGTPFPPAGLRMTASTVLMTLALGVLVTVVAAVLPARAAQRVAPVEALRTDAGRLTTRNRRRIRGLFAIAFVMAGAMTCIWSAAGGRGQLPAAVGGVIAFLGVMIAGPLTVPRLAQLIARPFLRVTGTPGSIASQNASRNPERTAATSATLTIGMTLVTLFGVLAASISADVHQSVSDNFPADYVVQATQKENVPPKVAERLRQDPRLAHVYEVRRSSDAAINGSDTDITGVPQDLLRAMRPKLISGSTSAFRNETVVLSATLAKSLHVHSGNTVALTGAGGPPRPLVVAAVYTGNLHASDAVITLSDFTLRYQTTGDDMVMVKARPGLSPTASRKALDAATADDPLLVVQDAANYEASLDATVNRLLDLLNGLLALAILISLIGITNTLGLAVIERRSELTLLRVLGLTRRQLRSTITLEGALVSVAGGAIGVACGVGWGWVLVRSTPDQIVTGVTVPFAQLLIYLAVTVVIGMVAATLPAHQAGRIEISTAMSDL